MICPNVTVVINNYFIFIWYLWRIIYANAINIYWCQTTTIFGDLFAKRFTYRLIKKHNKINHNRFINKRSQLRLHCSTFTILIASFFRFFFCFLSKYVIRCYRIGKFHLVFVFHFLVFMKLFCVLFFYYHFSFASLVSWDIVLSSILSLHTCNGKVNWCYDCFYSSSFFI